MLKFKKLCSKILYSSYKNKTSQRWATLGKLREIPVVSEILLQFSLRIRSCSMKHGIYYKTARCLWHYTNQLMLKKVNVVPLHSRHGNKVLFFIILYDPLIVTPPEQPWNAHSCSRKVSPHLQLCVNSVKNLKIFLVWRNETSSSCRLK